MTREFGEGERNERNERSEDETDELGELIDRIRARYEQTGKERDEDRPRVSEDDDFGSWPNEKDSALPEKSAEGLGKRSAEDRAERPGEEREIEEGPERTGDARQEQSEPDFGSFVEHLKARYGPDGGGEPDRAPAPERERGQGELDVGAYERGENDERLEQQSATSETKREGVSGQPERADDSPEAADPSRVGESPSGGVR